MTTKELARRKLLFERNRINRKRPAAAAAASATERVSIIIINIVLNIILNMITHMMTRMMRVVAGNYIEASDRKENSIFEDFPAKNSS